MSLATASWRCSTRPAPGLGGERDVDEHEHHPDAAHEVTVFSRLIRLLDEVEEVNRELERIEAKVQACVSRGARLSLRSTPEAE
jgi:hypothetical protein